MNNLKLLIIEDDKNICELVTLYAEKEGYQVQSANNGLKGLEMYDVYSPDLVILDIMLPEIDGWEVCEEIRALHSTPIIMLTGRGESYDRIKGLELGSDDYVTKPFDPKELMARVKAVLRRFKLSNETETLIAYQSLVIDMKKYNVQIQEQTIQMPPKEIELLFYMASNPNQVFTRQQLLDHVWGIEFDGDPRTVDVHIKRIREKITDNPLEWAIKTIRGIGYKFEVYNAPL